ncbi:MAG TPA: phosphoribosyltransferase family protein [Myxococcota bacterium]|nr:phosphoribosyltransferase family protein [Myxococcota bacterium]
MLFPPACAGCDAPGEAALCARCAARLPRIPRDACVLCQEASAAEARGRCARCARRASPLDACIAGTWFAEEPAAWIRHYKYPPRGLVGSGRDRARLRALAAESLGWRALATPSCVVPVPLHAARLRQRGFNPAASLARDLAGASGAPLAFALTRVRDTPSQTGLGRAGRRANVRGAFRVSGSHGACVWLVDDVVTTGATLEECARVLRAAGAQQVVALCAARTPAGIPPREVVV